MAGHEEADSGVGHGRAPDEEAPAPQAQETVSEGVPVPVRREPTQIYVRGGVGLDGDMPRYFATTELEPSQPISTCKIKNEHRLRMD